MNLPEQEIDHIEYYYWHYVY